MADKLKDKKPIIKVEEIEDETEVENIEESDSSKEEKKEVPEIKTATPVVSSFSQLDSPPPAPSDEKRFTLKENDEDKSLLEEKTDGSQEETENSKSENTSDKEQISSDEVKEWLKEVRPDTTKDVEKGRGSGVKMVIIIIILLFLLGAIVGGVLYFQKGVEKPSTDQNNNTETEISQTATPTPQEEEKIDLTNITVSVLNGSGIAGEAGKVKNLLITGGFSEDKITTGNADKYDYLGISISQKENLSDNVTEALNKTLSDTYDVTISEDNLQENSTYDVVIIVGK